MIGDDWTPSPLSSRYLLPVISRYRYLPLPLSSRYLFPLSPRYRYPRYRYHPLPLSPLPLSPVIYFTPVPDFLNVNCTHPP